MSRTLKDLRHRLRSQNRRNSAPSLSATGLKRSGAIRRPTNPLFSEQESDEGPFLRSRSNTMPTRQDEKKAEVNEGRTKTSDQSISFKKQVLEDLRLNEDMTDLSGTPSSSLSPSSGNSDTDSDTDTSQGWYDALEWNLERVGQLRDILRIWVEGNVSADEIGDFLVSCLYNCDDHLANRVTCMVDNREPYAHIARVLVEYFQIRDDEDKPLWTRIAPGDLNRRPGNYPGRQKSERMADGNEADSKEGLFYTCSAHIQRVLFDRPVRWPFFESGSEVDRFCLEPLTDEEGSGSDYDPWDDHLERIYLARLGNAEHRVQIAMPEDLTEVMTAELITPIESEYLIQTDESQDDTPAARLTSPFDVGPFHLSDLLDTPRRVEQDMIWCEMT